jgi:hypothetical protein
MPIWPKRLCAAMHACRVTSGALVGLRALGAFWLLRNAKVEGSSPFRSIDPSLDGSSIRGLRRR